MARDWEGTRVRAVDAMTDGALLHFAAFDGSGGVLLQRHDTDAANAAQSSGGPRLLDLCVLSRTPLHSVGCVHHRQAESSTLLHCVALSESFVAASRTIGGEVWMLPV